MVCDSYNFVHNSVSLDTFCVNTKVKTEFGCICKLDMAPFSGTASNLHSLLSFSTEYFKQIRKFSQDDYDPIGKFESAINTSERPFDKA